MSLHIPSWDEFAWAAFLYGALGGDKSYQDLMTKTTFLNALRYNPHQLSKQELRTELMFGFLNKWRCRIENNDQTALDLKNELQRLKPFINTIISLNITTVIFSEQRNINGKLYTIDQIIKELYRRYRFIGHRFGPTCTSKLLHILQPDLFVMWDGPIINYYKRLSYRISELSQGYVNYLHLLQNFAQQLYQSFQNTSLNPNKSPHQTPEHYLSINMGHKPQKSMAKYLDEYNWVTITKNVTVPPKWHP